MLQRISLDEALACIALHLAAARKPVERVALEHSLGRVMAEALRAPFALPRFSNSAVDGFAVCAESLRGDETTLQLVGNQFAGAANTVFVAPGQCAAISTGAAIPSGADSVVMWEDCTRTDSQVRIQGAVQRGQWVRYAGEEYAQNDVVLHAGDRLDAARVALAASFGSTMLRCVAKPRVVVLASGDELVTPSHEHVLQGSQIFDANRPLLTALLAQDGADVFVHPLLPDQEGAIESALLQAATRADLIITTGGASAGAVDFMPRIIQKLGTVHFWRVRIKPGMPALFGEVSGVPILALPGNPVSVLSTYLLLARPALMRLSGQEPKPWLQLPVPLAHGHQKQHMRREFARAALRLGGDTVQAHLVEGQGSHRLSSLLGGQWQNQRDAHIGFLDLPEGVRSYEPGERVMFTPFAGLL